MVLVSESVGYHLHQKHVVTESHVTRGVGMGAPEVWLGAHLALLTPDLAFLRLDPDPARKFSGLSAMPPTLWE